MSNSSMLFTIEQLIDIEYASEARLSPDGKVVAFVKGKSHKPDKDIPAQKAIYVVEVQSRAMRPLEDNATGTNIHQMGFVKDDYEVAGLRRAFEVQTKIFEAVMRALRPGENESLGQAIYDYEIQIRSADQVSHGMKNDLYSASIIVGSGKNSAIPHYLANNQVIQDGDLVLIDTGVAVDGYFSDITRTFPANGRFTPRQREVYAIVLEAELAAIETMKPGSTMLAAHQAVYDVFKKYDLDQYGYGNCGHPVGLNIHDANGRYPDDRQQPFEPGVVVVIEPFLMLTDEGMGIRIEDGVLITEGGHEVLAGPPKEIAAVEQLCRRD